MDGFDGAAEARLEDEARLEGEPSGEPGLVYGTVTGYRWWILKCPDWGGNPLAAEWPAEPLHGQVSFWQPGLNRAQCLPLPLHDEPAPFLPCGCGFYGYWDLRYHAFGAGSGYIQVAGVIRASGHVYIGDLGFRAEKARIIALCPAIDQVTPVPRLGFYDEFEFRRSRIPGTEQSRLDAWAAVVSDRLAQMHPEARVFERVRAMQAVFPPDENYGLRPGGKPPTPELGPLRRRRDVPACSLPGEAMQGAVGAGHRESPVFPARGARAARVRLRAGYLAGDRPGREALAPGVRAPLLRRVTVMDMQVIRPASGRTDGVFGPEYTKIQTAFKRDGRKVIVPGDWTLPEFAYLADKAWTWTEKVDGTNIRLHWDGSKVTIGGRTDNAQVPASLVAALGPLTDPGLWHGIFPDADDVTVYGEGYGAKIQSGGMYRPDQALIVFDVLVGRWWLADEDIADVARKLGLDVVPSYGELSLEEAWRAITEGRVVSRWENARAEGLVGRTAVPLFTRAGDRLIVKMKVKDWADYQRRQPGSRDGN